MADTKRLQEQVDEIRELLSDASETLRQAEWAMQTLSVRLADARPTTSVPVVQIAPVPPETPPPDEPPSLRQQRHRRWVRGVPRADE